MKPARFFFMDARAAVPFVFAMLHLRWYTLAFAFLMTLIFYFFETRGLGFAAALRASRVWLTTKKRPNIRASDLSRMMDYGYEPVPKDYVEEEEDDKDMLSSMINKARKASGQKNTDKKSTDQKSGQKAGQKTDKKKQINQQAVGANQSDKKPAQGVGTKTVVPTKGAKIKTSPSH
jgi:hypothetical protein